MGDRRFRSAVRSAHSSFARSRSVTVPLWALLSLTANACLLGLLGLSLVRDGSLWVLLPGQSSAVANEAAIVAPATAALGPRHQLSYEEWVDLLGQEAAAAAANRPEHLTILAGDSLSLWFPPDLLPPHHGWLNQGISGETSAGLLQRLDLFEQTEPETILVMIGINDLIRGISSDTMLANQRLIVQTLKTAHPQAQIVVQSILPHAAEHAIWEGREQLLELPNSRIRNLNQALRAIAQEENVYYLDLYPLFSDSQGNMQLDLSTDGLHLSPRGYLVWRSALQLFEQIELQGNRR